MTVHKISTCVCGHGLDQHTGPNQSCECDNANGRCRCNAFRRRESPVVGEKAESEIVAPHLLGVSRAIRTIVSGLIALDDALQVALTASKPGKPTRRKSAVAVVPPILSMEKVIRPRLNSGGSDDQATKTELAILRVLAARAPRSTSRAMVSILSGYSTNSGSFTKAIANLRAAELVEKRSLALTHDFQTALCGKELI